MVSRAAPRVPGNGGGPESGDSGLPRGSGGGPLPGSQTGKERKLGNTTARCLVVIIGFSVLNKLCLRTMTGLSPAFTTGTLKEISSVTCSNTWQRITVSTGTRT